MDLNNGVKCDTVQKIRQVANDILQKTKHVRNEAKAFGLALFIYSQGPG